MDITPEKQHGRTYTPPEIADFVSAQICRLVPQNKKEEIYILDPACGDGALLQALVQALLNEGYATIVVYGMDMEESAVSKAQKKLKQAFASNISLHLSVQNYTDWIPRYLKGEGRVLFDIVIANPPYVRTQYQRTLLSVQALMKSLGLKGDIFLLFLQTLPMVLRDGGIMGAIVSNKLLQTKECKAVREKLISQYQIEHLWDLGDTKLFRANVLPLLFLLSRKQPCKPPKMTTVYEARGECASKTLLDLSDLLVFNGRCGFRARTFDVNQGRLRIQNGVWTIENERIRRWQDQIEKHTVFRLKECGNIRNGLKTTANKVFIRSRDEEVWIGQRFSDLELVFPIFVTKDATPYRAGKPSAWVLYPHGPDGSLLSLDTHPLSKRYLARHYQTLSARTYVEKDKWYKHHVGQSWSVFKQPKLIWKEISEAPEVWLDTNGFLVDGPLFFLSLRPDFAYGNWKPSAWLLFLLAYLNSSFVGIYLRVSSNEKLYSDKMRCNKKNMARLPIPRVRMMDAKEALAWMEFLRVQDCMQTRARVDRWIWSLFGFAEPVNPLKVPSPAEVKMDLHAEDG